MYIPMFSISVISKNKVLCPFDQPRNNKVGKQQCKLIFEQPQPQLEISWLYGGQLFLERLCFVVEGCVPPFFLSWLHAVRSWNVLLSRSSMNLFFFNCHKKMSTSVVVCGQKICKANAIVQVFGIFGPVGFLHWEVDCIIGICKLISMITGLRWLLGKLLRTFREHGKQASCEL